MYFVTWKLHFFFFFLHHLYLTRYYARLFISQTCVNVTMEVLVYYSQCSSAVLLSFIQSIQLISPVWEVGAHRKHLWFMRFGFSHFCLPFLLLITTGIIHFFSCVFQYQTLLYFDEMEAQKWGKKITTTSLYLVRFDHLHLILDK